MAWMPLPVAALPAITRAALAKLATKPLALIGLHLPRTLLSVRQRRQTRQGRSQRDDGQRPDQAAEQSPARRQTPLSRKILHPLILDSPRAMEATGRVIAVTSGKRTGLTGHSSASDRRGPHPHRYHLLIPPQGLRTTMTLPTNGPKKLLVVDDDPRMRDLLRRYLSDNGLDVSVAADAQAMNRLMQREPYDLLILDLMLPGEDGLSIIRRLRANGERIPVIMLTAKGDDVDRIVGLEIGADDYLPKPFNPRELLARIHAVLRRQPAPELPGAPSAEPAEVAFGPFVLNLATRSLTRDQQPVGLTSGEFSVLKTLVRHPRTPLSREKLMNLARGREYGAYDRSLDVQVSRLRKLIETDPQNPRYIQTVWGVGYVFVPDGD
jgi:two-component system, OmpR family, phosphate regulon response regulator OmpR